MERENVLKIIQETRRLSQVANTTGVDRGSEAEGSWVVGEMDGDIFAPYGRFDVTPFSEFTFSGKADN
jgi:hypothetical protein